MESLIHAIDELQRIADDLATTESPDTDRAYDDCEIFLARIENFISDNNLLNPDYLSGKLREVRANFGYLLRGNTTELERYQALVHNGLSSLYRNIHSPVTAEADDEAYNA
jgi:hypothetical protein